MTPQEVISEYLGVPYKHGGRDLNGLDCWGLILRVYERLGFEIWDINEPYDEKWSFKGKNHFIENYWREWELVEKPAPLDGVLFHNGSGVVNHAGLVIDEHRFIHACKLGVVVTRFSDAKMKKRFNGFYHLKARK